MKKFFAEKAKGLKYASLLGMIIIPVLLYFAAQGAPVWPVYALLGLMGISMLVAMKVG